MPIPQSLLLTVALAATGLAAGPAAQSARSQNATIQTYDHVHLAAPSPETAVAWYIKHMGGSPGESPIHVAFRERLLVEFPFQEQAKALPSAGGAIDNVGFSVSDVTAAIDRLSRDGVKIVSPVETVAGLWKRAAVEDPFGTKIELVENPDRLGVHHATLRVPDPDVSVKFYLDVFGGQRIKLKGKLDAVDYGNFYLIIEKGNAAPSFGRAIDHLGWRPANIDVTVADMKAKGVKFITQLEAGVNARGHRQFYVEAPGGVRIQIIEHTELLKKP